MSNIQSSDINTSSPISTIGPPIPRKLKRKALSDRRERIKAYFTTNHGRIIIAEFCFTIICIVLQHVMGTCEHSISNGNTVIHWYVFSSPFGAGPHTATFFFVLSWITLVYCIQRMWIYSITDVPLSQKRDLIINSILVILYFLALGFNIWGYVLCESKSQVASSKNFTPGVCRGDSQTCIPLIAGVIASCATACAFASEQVLALMKFLKRRQESKKPISSRMLL